MRQDSATERLRDDEHDKLAAFQPLLVVLAQASEDLRQLDQRVIDATQERDRAYHVWFEAKQAVRGWLKAEGADW